MRCQQFSHVVFLHIILDDWHGGFCILITILLGVQYCTYSIYLDPFGNVLSTSTWSIKQETADEYGLCYFGNEL